MIPVIGRSLLLVIGINTNTNTNTNEIFVRGVECGQNVQELMFTLECKPVERRI